MKDAYEQVPIDRAMRRGRSILPPMHHDIAHADNPLLVSKTARRWLASLTFSPLGNRVLTRSNDSARLWDARTGAPVGNPMRDQICVGFSPQGDRILTIGEGNTTQLWDAMTGKPIGETRCHNDKVTSVVFSPQGDRLLTGSKDHAARL
jgi:WD40 repeat protein